MSSTTTAIPLNEWLRASPTLSGAAERDLECLSGYVRAGEDLLALMPRRPNRSEAEELQAATIHRGCRTVRGRFLKLHADWLYGRLTGAYTVRKNLSELAFEAAECCPGLVPTMTQIAKERTRLQAEKEGYEIDQGIFFCALLASKRVGSHLLETALQPTARSLELIERFRTEARLDLGSVLIERRGPAAHLTINNGYCLNAEDNRSVDDMETAVDLALLDDETRVGVLRGGIMTHPRYAGRRVFSAGINLKALHAGQISFVDFLLRRELGYINKIIRGLLLDPAIAEILSWRSPDEPLEKPWIAAVDSFAIGGGTQLLLAFDRVIAATDSFCSLPAAREGIVPGFSSLRLARFVGSRKARQVILCGRRVCANEPDANLLFDEVVSPSEMDTAIERNVQQMSNCAVVANRHMLNVAEESTEEYLRYASEFARIQAERLYSRDVLEKVWRA